MLLEQNVVVSYLVDDNIRNADKLEFIRDKDIQIVITISDAYIANIVTQKCIQYGFNNIIYNGDLFKIIDEIESKKKLDTSCCICGCPTSTLLNKDGKSFIVGYRNSTSYLVKCNSCSHVFFDPIPTDEVLEIYYSEDEWDKYTIDDHYRYYFRDQVNFPTCLARQLLSFFDDPIFMDFGCGYGPLVYKLQQNDTNVIGFDFSSKRVKLGVERHADLKITNSLDELAIYKKNINIFWASHVIEHVNNLDRYMRTIDEYLADNSVLCMRFPNSDYYVRKEIGTYDGWNWCFFPGHIHYFNIRSIEELLVKYNLDICYAFSPLLDEEKDTTMKVFKNQFKNYNDAVKFMADNIAGTELVIIAVRKYNRTLRERIKEYFDKNLEEIFLDVY